MIGLRSRDFPAAATVDQPCSECGKSLNMERAVWLELDQRTDRFVDPNVVTVPPDKSQGCFAFGAACARKVLK